MKFLNDLSVKAKTIAGYGLMQILILVIAASALFSLSHTQGVVTEVADDIQPALLKASALEHALDRSTSALGFYLLSHEESHKQAYADTLQQAGQLLEELHNQPLVQADAKIGAQVDAIADDVARFRTYQPRMLELVERQDKNFPALAYAAQNINPVSQQLLQLVSGMIQSESEEEPSEERRRLLLEMEALRYAWANVMNGVRAYLAFRQSSAEQEVNLYLGSVDLSLARLQEMSDLLSLDQADALEQFLPLKQKFITNLGKMIALHGSAAWRSDAQLLRSEIGPLVAAIGDKVAALKGDLSARAEAAVQGLAGQVTATNALLTGLLVAGLLFGALIALFMMGSVIKPLNHTVDALEDIVEGEGDLTRRLRVESRDEVGRLAAGFNKFAGLVHGIVHDMAGYTTRLRAAAERLSVVTAETSQGVDQQQQRTDEVVAAVNQMAASGREVAQNTGAAAEAARNADSAANDGRRVVARTTEVIDSLAEAVRRAGEVINRLEQDSESIGGVLDVIRGIAEQTNLLALNAAIEAARAGEQGRGFAVVADEVRTLASRTQESTQEIQGMIERLQNGAREAVTVMEQGTARADESVHQAGEAGEALNAISQAVAVINEMNVQIASAAEEQNAVAEEINRAVVAISQITEQTAAGAQQTASASNELEQLSGQLSQMVGRFRV